MGGENPFLKFYLMIFTKGSEPEDRWAVIPYRERLGLFMSAFFLIAFSAYVHALIAYGIAHYIFDADFEGITKIIVLGMAVFGATVVSVAGFIEEKADGDHLMTHCNNLEEAIKNVKKSS